MIQRKRYDCLILATLIVGACGKGDTKSKSAPDDSHKESSFQVDSLGEAAPVLSLISAGASEREPRIYGPRGGKRSAVLSQKVAIEGMEEHVTTMKVTLDWTRPSALGQPWKFDVRAAESDMIPADADEGERQIGEAIFAAYKMIEGQVRASDSTHFSFVQTQGLPTQPSLLANLHSLAVPLPTEAIGVGAKWEVTQELAQQNMSGQLIRQYELLSADDSILSFQVSGSTDWKPAVAGDPDLGMEILAIRESLTGVIQIDLGDLLPQSADLKGELKTRIKVKIDQVESIDENTIGYSLRLEPKL